jgi:serine/threonine-protein kinase
MTRTEIGRYQIRGVLGQGGMAVVYRGYDPHFEREVAVKVLGGDLPDDPQFRMRFQREAKIIASLDHPAIVPVYDFGEDNGELYLVMRLMKGGTLTARMQEGPLSPPQIAAIFSRIASALDEAHARGIVHRDLKPANILFDQRDTSYLADFGIVKLSNSTLAMTGEAVVGTPAYMSPEQMKGETIDGRSDIYSLGAVLYQALTGKQAYRADTPVALAMKHLTEPVPDLMAARPDLPTAFGQIINHSMAKRREDRYATAGEMAAELEAACRAEATQAIRHDPTRVMAQPAPTVSRPAPPVTPPATTPARAVSPAPPPPVAVPAAAPPAATSRPATGRTALIAGGLLLLLLLCAGGAFAAYQSGLLGGLLGTAEPTPVAAVATEAIVPTATSQPTATAEPPTDTPMVEPTLRPTNTPAPTRTRPPATATRTPTATPAPTETASPTIAPTAAATRPAAGTGQGLPLSFESFGAWGRGDQANGTFEQSSEQAFSGGSSGKLSYSFQTADNDYVVFLQTNDIAGAPTALRVWVFGDGSGYYLNAWIIDAEGETWQVPLGRVSHSGWGQMSGEIRTGQAWPWVHIGGPSNESVDYPIRFRAFVLDDYANTDVRQGAIYLDDLTAE